MIFKAYTLPIILSIWAPGLKITITANNGKMTRKKTFDNLSDLRVISPVQMHVFLVDVVALSFTIAGYLQARYDRKIRALTAFGSYNGIQTHTGIPYVDKEWEGH